jgi:archaetidylinositol phosphate synthase
MTNVSPLYASQERVLMDAVHRASAAVLLPAARFFDACGMKADHVSALSGCMAVAGLGMAIALQDVFWLVGGIWLHVILDGLDGTLARYQGAASQKGAIADAVCDHAGIAAFSAGLIWFGLAEALPAGLLFLLYSSLVASSILLGLRDAAIPFMIRPRLLLYAALTADMTLGTHLLLPALNLSILLLAFFSGIAALKLCFVTSR